MRKRTRYTLLAALIFLCALAAMVYLRQKAPPEAARLLPESDAIFYLNLKPVRLATHFDRNPVTLAAAYQQFIDATGINPERDLDAVAVALHAMPNPKGPNGPVAFSIVWQGHFDRARLTEYLASIATSQEDYAGRTIYSIPSPEGYTDRVALLGYDTIATTNMPTPEQIHSILDRNRAAASPFSGSSLLGARYRDVPAFSIAWAVGRIGLPFVEQGKINVLGLDLPLPADTTFVASLRYTTSLNLRIEQIAPSEAQAADAAQTLTHLLALVSYIRQAQQPTPQTPSDVALRDFVQSIKIEQHKDRAVLTAVVPTDALKHLADTAPAPPGGTPH
jgi:hypothetical protein